METTPDQEWLTVSEVMPRLRVSRKTVYRWIKQDLLPAMKLPGSGGRGHWRISEAVVEKMIANGYRP